MFTSQQFAHNLKNSSLSPQVQQALLNLLPTLTNEQIDEIGEALLQDTQEQENILKQLQLKIDILKKNR